MNARLRMVLAKVIVMVMSLLVLRVAAETTAVKPEDVGLSSERLLRITEMMKRHIAAGEISGGVTLVARHGRIAHFEATGVTDIESKKPMTKDAVFRIASMTKPVTGVAIMMMMEEGKLRITDPVSKYIPSFKDLKVAVAQPRQGPPAGAGGTRSHDSRSADARVRSCQRADEQRQHPQRGADTKADGHARRLHPAPREEPARIPAGLSLDLQSPGRLRHARPHRRDHLGSAVRSVRSPARVRSARQPRRPVLPDAGARGEDGDTLSTRPEREDGEEPEPRWDAEQGLLHGVGRAGHNRGGIREVRADARQRRRAEWQTAPEPAHGCVHGVGARLRHASGPRARRRLRPERSRRSQRRRERLARVRRQLRLERRLRHALLGGSEGGPYRDHDDPDAGA